jgi:GNAT superfamily N-acetyltransferase
MRQALPHELDRLVAIDDDSAGLYAEHGLALELADDHPFVLGERARWLAALERGHVFVVEHAGELAGFAALDSADGQPYLEQLSVRRAAMRRGIGGALLERAARWASERGGSHLWLTTYAHLAFNRPYYERRGFVVVPEAECGPELRHHLDEERRALPRPAERVAMRRSLAATGGAGP